MSYFGSGKYIQKKARNQFSSSQHSTHSTSVQTMLKKIEEAERKRLFRVRYDPESGTEVDTNVEEQPASPDDSHDGACALKASFVDSNRIREEKESLAKKLSDPVLMWTEYFSGVIVDDAANAVEENLEEGENDYSHSTEVNEAVARGEHRFANVCSFPLKLVLTPLNRGHGLVSKFASIMNSKFGPLHAALQVGDVVLEWNDSSLVIPHLCKHEDKVMEIDMQSRSKWVECAGRHHSEIQGQLANWITRNKSS